MKEVAIERDSGVSDEVLGARLAAHPILKARVMGLLDLVEGADSVALADEAERRVIEALRGMGHELLTDWAQRRVMHTAQGVAAPHVTKHEKKSFSGTAPMAPSKSPNKRGGTGRASG